jgi:hypothetical protein
MAAHRYWRLLLHQNQGQGDRYSIAELKGAITVGGANVLTGGTASASSTLGGQVASNAFDNDPATYWASAIYADSITLNYDLGAGNDKDVIEISITNRDSFTGQSPTVFEWQYSDDGVSYTTLMDRITPPTWTAGETRTFNTSPTTFEHVSQARVLSAVGQPTTAEHVSQARALVSYTGYSEALRVSQARTLVAEAGPPDERVSQAAVLVAVRGIAATPKLIAWEYSLDGHDNYVLRLGKLGSLVLDLATGQWSEWNGHNQLYWRPHVGTNWLGMGKATAGKLYGTNIVAGDDQAGILWMLDPTKGVDDGLEAGDDEVPYVRSVSGLVPQTMRQTVPDGAVYLTISLGDPSVTGAGISLSISDDWGKTYRDAGTITVDPDNFEQEISWRALGLIKAPGRIYQFTDSGAAVRINYMERR